MLCVTHSAVSKQIKQLEAALGVALFVQDGRNRRLSSDGLLLYQSCKRMFAELTTTLDTLTHKNRQDLTVSCETTLAMKWLIPRITTFPKDYGFNIAILTAGGAVDFQRQNIDVAIRRNDFTWPPTLHAEYIAPERVGAVHAPLPYQPHRLHTHSRIDAWQQWTEQHPDNNYPNEDIFFGHFYLTIQAAIAGLGIAIASQYMVADEISKGILKCPQGFFADGSAYYLLSATPIAQDERKRLFLDWLKQQMN